MTFIPCHQNLLCGSVSHIDIPSLHDIFPQDVCSLKPTGWQVGIPGFPVSRVWLGMGRRFREASSVLEDPQGTPFRMKLFSDRNCPKNGS